MKSLLTSLRVYTKKGTIFSCDRILILRLTYTKYFEKFYVGIKS